MSMFKNQENKKDYNDSIFILIDVGKEKCTVMSTVYQDRNVKIHNETFDKKKKYS